MLNEIIDLIKRSKIS